MLLNFKMKYFQLSLKVDSAEAGLQRSGVRGLLLPHVRLSRQNTSPRSAVNHVGTVGW